MKSLLVLLFGVHLTHSQLLYRCNEFHSNDTCGRNLLPNSQWVIHRTYDLYEVSIASSWDTLLTVLYFNATDANSAIYEVNPVPVEPEIHRVCFQYEVIESDECEDPIHCATEIHLSLEDGLQVESTSRWKYWNYGWNLVMVQFDWNQTESLAELRFTLKGSILRPDQLTPYVKSPYLAIRYVYIFAGGCTPRIGPHQSFWIGIMVVFSGVTTLPLMCVLLVRSTRHTRAIQQHKLRTLISHNTDLDSLVRNEDL